MGTGRGGFAAYRIGPAAGAKRLAPGDAAELAIEVSPTSIVVPAGFRTRLPAGRRDNAHPGGGARPADIKNEPTGSGLFPHDDPRDWPPGRFAGTATLHPAPGRRALLLSSIVPAR